MPRVKKPKCRVDGCDREVSSISLCAACYHRMRYWSTKTVREQLKRLDRLHVFETTMAMGLGNIKKLRPSKIRQRRSA